MLDLPPLSSSTKTFARRGTIKSSSSSRFCEKFRETRVETRPSILGSASNALAERRTFRSRVVLLRTRLRFARDYVLVGERNSVYPLYIYISFLSLSFLFYILFSPFFTQTDFIELRNNEFSDPGSGHGLLEISELSSIIYYLVTGLKEKKKKKNYLIERVRHAKIEEEEEEEEGEQVLLADGTLRLYRFHLSGSK